MVYYKLTLNEKRETKEKTYPVVVRVTFNKNNITFTTGIRVRKEHWDSESQLIIKANSNFQILNKAIGEYYLKIQKIIHQLDDENEFSFSLLKERLESNFAPIKTMPKKTFKEFSDTLIQQLMSINKTGNALVYQTACNRLIGFIGNNNLKFKEIDYRYRSTHGISLSEGRIEMTKFRCSQQ